MFIIGILLDFLVVAAKVKRESWFMSIWQIAVLTNSCSVHNSCQTLIKIPSFFFFYLFIHYFPILSTILGK